METETQAKLGDIVFEDRDANGIQDLFESGITNVTVNLKDKNGFIINTTITDANGNYSFDVDPGIYSIGIVTPTGFIITEANQGTDGALDSDIDNASGMSSDITLVAGETNLDIDAGLFQLAELGDRVWVDSNKNGLQDNGEAGVQGVSVTLLDVNDNAIGDPLTTGANGNYLFTGLRPGAYSIFFDKTTLPAGHNFTEQDVGGNNRVDSDVDVNDGKTAQVILTSGESDTTVDAGDAGIVKNPIMQAKLGDRIWLDANSNGIQDAGEAGAAGITVALIDADGTTGDLIDKTVTDTNGNYLFLVDDGEYKVQFIVPDNFAISLDNVGDDTKDSDFTVAVQPAPDNISLIVNGSFENPNVSSWSVFDNIPGWTGMGDQIEIGNSSVYRVGGATGDQVLEIDAGRVGDATGVFQDVDTVAGESYELSLDVALRPQTRAATNTVVVEWNGEVIAVIDPTSTTFQTYTFTVTGTGTDRLKLREQSGGDDSYGGLVDNVRLVASNTPVGIDTIAMTDTIIIDNSVDNLTIDASVTPAVIVTKDANFNFSGSSNITGPSGNIRTFTENGATVDVSAYSRSSSGDWNAGYVNVNSSGGLGVTNTGENGFDHRVDNGTQIDYLLLEFDKGVTVNQAFLNQVGHDSDISVWVGDRNGADITILSDSLLEDFTKEDNFASSNSSRWADFNDDELTGDTLVISAYTGGTNDQFELSQLLTSY